MSCPACAATGAERPYVNNHLVLAILSTVFCCQLVGLLAVFQAGQVKFRLATGDVAGARLASRRALWIALLNFLLCLALAIVGTAVVLGFAGMKKVD